MELIATAVLVIFVGGLMLIKQAGSALMSKEQASSVLSRILKGKK